MPVDEISGKFFYTVSICLSVFIVCLAPGLKSSGQIYMHTCVYVCIYVYVYICDILVFGLCCDLRFLGLVIDVYDMSDVGSLLV